MDASPVSSAFDSESIDITRQIVGFDYWLGKLVKILLERSRRSYWNKVSWS